MSRDAISNSQMAPSTPVSNPYASSGDTNGYYWVGFGDNFRPTRLDTNCRWRINNDVAGNYILEQYARVPGTARGHRVEMVRNWSLNNYQVHPNDAIHGVTQVGIEPLFCVLCSVLRNSRCFCTFLVQD